MASIASLLSISAPTGQTHVRRILSDRQFFFTAQALPISVHTVCTRFAHSAVCMTSFPGCGRESVFCFLDAAFCTQPLGFAAEANTVKATRFLLVLRGKVCLHMPLLAHVALPGSSCIRKPFTTFSTDAIGITTFPLRWCIHSTWPLTRAHRTWQPKCFRLRVI